MADSYADDYYNKDNDEYDSKKRRDYDRERSSESDRSRDSDRRRRRSRKRSRRSRDRSYTRSSSRSRSRSRKRNRRRWDYDDYGSGSEGDYRHYQREASPPDNRSDRGRSRWNDGTPNNVLLIRNLALHQTEGEVRGEFEQHGVAIREVRLMRSRETGDSLRYCFVEFYSVPEAQDWMQFNQGEMKVEGGRTWYMYYSNTRRGTLTPGSSSSLIEQDWLCTKCSCANFQRRSFCRRCSHAREDTTRRSAYMTSMMSDGSDQVGTNPCNTLLLRGLDGLTTEETIISAILQHTGIQTLNCHVARDKDTGASNGYALIELTSAMEAGVVLKQLSASSHHSSTPSHPLEVDGKVLVVNYARNNFNTALSAMYAPDTQSSSTPRLTMPTCSKDFSENTAAAVAQAAMMKRRPTFHNQPTTMPTRPTPTNAYPKYPTPDTSKFTFDQASGYYLDPTTNFYYDAKTQYFYNAHKQHFMYWDADQQTYIPVANDNQTTTATNVDSTVSPTTTAVTATAAVVSTSTSATTSTLPTSAHNDKAKKIAKDMERWAKRMNSQKESMKPVIQAAPQVTVQSANPVTIPAVSTALTPDGALSTQNAGKNKLEKLDQLYSSWEDNAEEAPVSKQFSMPSDKSSPPRTSSPAEADKSLVDWERLTCVLCRRAFLNQDTLQKHLQLSSLHKTNLAEYLKTQGDSETQTYRDRASERRKKFGGDEPPPQKKGRKKEVEVPVEMEQKATEAATTTTTSATEEENNVASKLMRKMGWKEGDGLGRNLQGIVDPIQATMRQSLAGLGSRVLETPVDGLNHYNDRLKNTFRAYFNDIK